MEISKIIPFYKNEVEAVQQIAHNRTETAQKLQEAQKTINTLVNQKADVVAQNLAFKEQIAELTQTISVKNKVLDADKTSKKSFLDHFKAPQGAQFWGFLKQKINGFMQQIKELKAENQALKAENQSLKLQQQKPKYEHEYERIQAKVRAELRAEQEDTLEEVQKSIENLRQKAGTGRELSR